MTVARFITKLRRWLRPWTAGTEAMGIQLAILEEIESRIETTDAGDRSFPFDRLTVHLLAPTAEERDQLEAIVQGGWDLARAVSKRLEILLVQAPSSLEVEVRVTDQPAPEFGERRFFVEYRRKLEAWPRGRAIGRFEVRDFLGRGALGDVFLAWDPARQSEVALKVIRVPRTDPEMLAAERSALTLQQRLSPRLPGLAPVYETGQEGDFFWAAMEYVQGNDLGRLLTQGPLPEARAIGITRQVLSILDVLHRFSGPTQGRKNTGIVHGDICPGNLLLQPGDRVRLLDIGAAKNLSITRTANLFGRLPYTPPERLERGGVDRHSDLWGVAVLLYEMVAGTSPFPGETFEEVEARIRRREPPSIPASVSPELARILAKALSHEVDRRYPSAAAFLADLKALERRGREPDRRRGRLPASRVPWSFPEIRLPALRRLDHLPPWAAWALGLGGGALAGAGLVGGAPVPVGAAGFLALLGAATALAWSGEPVAMLEAAAPSAAPELALPSLSGLPDLEMVAIPAGTFRMGSPKEEEGRYHTEGPVHEVRVSAFQCLRVPVTRRLYAVVTGEDPGLPKGKTDDRPVNNVSWLQAVDFCNRLSEQVGLRPCYQRDGEEVFWDRAADGFRLPTEAEWEYACRAGTETRWSFGEDAKQLGEHAWYKGNSERKPRPVGRKRPNPWGLHDMHGSVWEWCWDWFGPYSFEFQADPAGPNEGSGRVLRGGSFAFSPKNVRSAYRVRSRPEFRNAFIGFRCVQSPVRQHRL